MLEVVQQLGESVALLAGEVFHSDGSLVFLGVISHGQHVHDVIDDVVLTMVAY